MNQRGQVVIYSFMLGLVAILMALFLAGDLKTQIDTTRNAANLDCANTSISNGVKMTCTSTDLLLFYFVGGVIFLGGAAIAARKFL